MKRLLAIQTELKCNKSQYNSFAKYNYRSCEDILEAVKPLLKKHDVCLTLSDELVFNASGTDTYICALATLFDAKTNEVITQTKAFAQMDKSHKGMTADQVSGCASSYARKYCLSAMLLIDDQKDSDTDENHIQREGKTETKPITDKQLGLLTSLCDQSGKTDDVLNHYKVKTLADLDTKQAGEVISALMKKASK